MWYREWSWDIPEVVLFWGSKVKVTWSITLHKNTSFRTTITFDSHSLGRDTSTITLQPCFIVIRYSLGGDTDKSNTAWVRTLWVHSSYSRRDEHMLVSFVGDNWVGRSFGLRWWLIAFLFRPVMLATLLSSAGLWVTFEKGHTLTRTPPPPSPPTHLQILIGADFPGALQQHGFIT